MAAIRRHGREALRDRLRGERWCRGGPHRAAVALVVVAGLLVSMSALAPPAARAEDAPSEPVTTETTMATECVGVAMGLRVGETNPLSFSVTAPEVVEQNQELTVRIAPAPASFPNERLGFTVNYLQAVNLMYDLPSNATVLGVSIVPGTAQGIEGTPTVAVDAAGYSPPRIVLKVPKVPKNMVPPTNETFFTYPAVDVTVRATGAPGSTVQTRVAGTSETTSGYKFQASSVAMADVTCWPAGGGLAPTMSSTSIVPEASTIPTTTALDVDPRVLPAGYPAVLAATVSAPMGTVRFTDGTVVLGEAPVVAEGSGGVARLEATFADPGAHAVTASYLGTVAYDPSTSDPVAVTVTDPADRDPVQVQLTAASNRVNVASPTVTTAPAVAVRVLPTAGVTAPPTGLVRLFDGDALLATEPLVGGEVSFSEPLELGGHALRAEYLGDVDYFPATGTTSVSVVLTANLASNAGVDRPVVGSTRLNDGTVAALPDAVVNSTFRTGGDGRQMIDGVLTSASTVIAVPGGTVTGQLVPIGVATGDIAPGSDGAARLSAELGVVVTGLDLGAGATDFASTCFVGPFTADLTGQRAGTAGAVALSASGFAIPAPAAGTCVDAAGVSWAAQVGGLLAGADTDLALSFTPPPAAEAVTISAVSTSVPFSFFEQAVTLSASISRTSGVAWPSGAVGAVEFYDGDTLLGSASPPSTAGASRQASFTLPLSSVRPALPVGDHQLTAVFVPSNSMKNTYASSDRSGATSHRVFDLAAKATPTLHLEVPEVARSSEPTTVRVILDPAPNEVAAPAPLTGTIAIQDLAAGRTLDVRTSPALSVNASSDGVLEAEIALAPGAHRLQAIFTPTPGAASWWWNPARSGEHDHVVVGETFPTSLEIVSESTRGSGVVLGTGTTAWQLQVQLDPAVVPALGPWPPSLQLELDGVVVASRAVDSAGRLTIFASYLAGSTTPGDHRVVVRFEPTSRNPGIANLSNQGFAPSSVTFDYTVVTPGVPGPAPTGTEIVTTNPLVPVQGTTWPQIQGAYSTGASGSIAFSARNTATGVTTALGSASSGSGTVNLNNAAATATLPAGLYEVTGAFTPTDPSRFAPSTSAPHLVQVVDPASPVATTTSLEVSPDRESAPAEAIELTATVAPAAAAYGTVEFFDGATSLGTAPVSGGVATTAWYWPETGLHSYSAVFTPTSTTTVVGSTSTAVDHAVGFGVPEAPWNVIAQPGPRQVTLSWDEPPYDGGTPVTGYTVTTSPGGAILRTPASITSVDVIGLDPATAYTLTVTAENASGSSSGATSAEVTPGPATMSFSDVPSSHPFSSEIIWLAEAGITTGYADGTFQPTGLIAREAMAAFLYRMAGAPFGADPTCTSKPATDVAIASAFCGEIAWLIESGISTGYADGTFRPGASVAREAMAAFLYRAAGSPEGIDPGCATAPFTDVPVTSSFCGEIAWTASVGITAGYPNGSFQPGGTITRQAMAAFLYRYTLVAPSIG